VKETVRENQPAAEARAESNEGDMLEALSGATAPLAIGSGIGVIFGQHRNRQFPLQQPLEIDIADAGNVRRGLNNAGARVPQPGNSNTHRRDSRVGLEPGNKVNKGGDQTFQTLGGSRRLDGFCYRAERVDSRSLDCRSSDINPDIVHLQPSSLV